jgi:diguanylate cyclase
LITALTCAHRLKLSGPNWSDRAAPRRSATRAHRNRAGGGVTSSALPEETFQQRRAESEPIAARPPVELAPRPEPRRQTAVPPWLTRLTTLMLAVAAVVTLAAAVASVPPMSHHVGTVARACLYDTVYALAVPLLVLRAVFVPAQRGTWALFALGMGSYASAAVYSFMNLLAGRELPFPSVCDLGWLLLYPFCYAAIVLLIRAEVRLGRLRTLLDGAVAGLGIAAASSLLVFDVLWTPATASGGELAHLVELAYPTGDALLIATLLCLWTVSGRAGRGRLAMLAVGVLALAIADTGYLALVAHDEYAPGTGTDVLYLSGSTMISAAAWRTRKPAWRPPPAAPGVPLVLPLVSALFALGVLLTATQEPVSPVSISLAGLSLVCVVGRTLLAFRELRSLGQVRQREARRDELTGLANRRAFQEYVASRIAQPDTEAILLLLDLDRFKDVNDSFGHHAGDRLLCYASARLATTVRGTDFLARLGGDEFVIVFGAARLRREHVEEVARRLRAELRRPFDIDGVQVHIDVSAGIAAARPDDSAEDLLQHADIAMYEAKRAGCGHCWYSPGGEAAARTRLERLSALRDDVGTDAITLHYQPKIDLRTGAVAGVEALVRWHPRGGTPVYPDEFLALAEQAGLMQQLTANVLAQAVAQGAAWRRAGAMLTVAVNVSATDLDTVGFPAAVVDQLERHGLPPRALTLEITETTLMSSSPRTGVALSTLDALGVRVAIDDYGTSYSSLGYLQRLSTVDELKLDRLFVSQIAGNPRAAAIVKSSIELAHALGMIVVAEGVEDAKVLAQLRSWGCDQAQGYHISRPVPAGSLCDWLAAHRPAAWIGSST